MIFMVWPALILIVMIPLTSHIPCSFPIYQVLMVENVHPGWEFFFLGGDGFQSSTNAGDQNSEMRRFVLVILLLHCQKNIDNMLEIVLNMR